MKVLFLQLVPRIGHPGEIKEVNDSYARNYLLPKGLAKRVTEQEEKKYLLEKQKKEQMIQRKEEEKHTIAKSLDGKVIPIFRKTHGDGKIFGSITAKDISELLMKEYHLSVDKKSIFLWGDGSIKEIGKKEITIQVTPSFQITVILDIQDEWKH